MPEVQKRARGDDRELRRTSSHRACEGAAGELFILSGRGEQAVRLPVHCPVSSGVRAAGGGYADAVSEEGVQLVEKDHPLRWPFTYAGTST